MSVNDIISEILALDKKLAWEGDRLSKSPAWIEDSRTGLACRGRWRELVGRLGSCPKTEDGLKHIGVTISHTMEGLALRYAYGAGGYLNVYLKGKRT